MDFPSAGAFAPAFFLSGLVLSWGGAGQSLSLPTLCGMLAAAGGFLCRCACVLIRSLSGRLTAAARIEVVAGVLEPRAAMIGTLSAFQTLMVAVLGVDVGVPA